MRPSILVIDDEPTIAELISELLGDEGYTVAIAGTAKAAQALVAQHCFGLILQDVRLPDMAGVELTAWLRACPATAATPLVVMSASPLSAASALEAGATAMLIKPFDIDALLECVATYFPLEAAAGT
jgi:CheY-like chemotaxis protein